MLKTSRRATICSALLNTSKGVIRNRELVLATEEMSASLGKKRVTNIKRIIIGKKRRKNRNKRLHPDIQPTPHSQGGEGIWVERIEQYATAPPRRFKCQKYGHYRKACRGRQTCAKCSEKDPDHIEEECLKETRCANGQQNHPDYARSSEAYKKEKEILESKHKRNLSFLEARKIVDTNTGDNRYISVAQRADIINQDHWYKALVEKLMKHPYNSDLKNWLCNTIPKSCPFSSTYDCIFNPKSEQQFEKKDNP